MTALGGRFWAWVPAGLLGSMLLGLGTMAFIASIDPGFALERDYYRKAVGYDREIQQRAENARLGWRVDLSAGALRADGTASVLALARQPGGPLTGAQVSLEALRNAGASRVLEAVFQELAPGEYRVELPLNRGGLWEFRLTMARAGERATHVARLDVFEAR